MPEACHYHPELVQFTKFGGVLDIMNTFKKVVGVSTKVKKGASPKKSLTKQILLKNRQNRLNTYN